MSWLFFVFMAALMWSCHNVFIKILGEAVPASLAVALFYMVGALTSGLIYVFQSHKIMFHQLHDVKLISFIILAGITIGLTDYFYVTAFSKGAALSLAGPLFGTLGLLLIAAFGVFIFSEGLSLAKIAGFIFASIGIFLLAR